MGSRTDHPPRLNANGQAWEHADCELLEVIRAGMTPSVTPLRPDASRSTVTMPSWTGRLTDDEIRDVIAYVKTMWSDDQRASQERVTRERCS